MGEIASGRVSFYFECGQESTSSIELEWPVVVSDRVERHGVVGPRIHAPALTRLASLRPQSAQCVRLCGAPSSRRLISDRKSARGPTYARFLLARSLVRLRNNSKLKSNALFCCQPPICVLQTSAPSEKLPPDAASGTMAS